VSKSHRKSGAGKPPLKRRDRIVGLVCELATRTVHVVPEKATSNPDDASGATEQESETDALSRNRNQSDI
jgi:hypothetical protein